MKNKFSAYSACLLLAISGASQADCNPSILETTPTAHFTDHGDGTVTHEKTGLMWKVCTEGQTWSSGACSAGTQIQFLWPEALDSANTANASGGYAGKTGWRLPNIKELASITELKCSGLAINTTIFPSTLANNYWSSSIDTENANNSLVIYFGDGGDLSKPRYEKESSYVRLVRAGG